MSVLGHHLRKVQRAKGFGRGYHGFARRLRARSPSVKALRLNQLGNQRTPAAIGVFDRLFSGDAEVLENRRHGMTLVCGLSECTKVVK